MKQLVFSLCFLSIVYVVNAQKRNITIVQSNEITSLIEKHIYFNSKQKTIGWRIQIFFDSGNNSKSKALSQKGIFMTMFPDINAYLLFQSPYYKVRVGDFRTRMEAEGFKQKLLSEFPDAFVVKDEINPPKFY